MEHSDPGLFALSFMSTNEGLELYDVSDDKWVFGTVVICLIQLVKIIILMLNQVNTE